MASQGWTASTSSESQATMNTDDLSVLKKTVLKLRSGKKQFPFVYFPSGEDGEPQLVIRKKLPSSAILKMRKAAKKKKMATGLVGINQDGVLEFRAKASPPSTFIRHLKSLFGSSVPMLKRAVVTTGEPEEEEAREIDLKTARHRQQVATTQATQAAQQRGVHDGAALLVELRVLRGACAGGRRRGRDEGGEGRARGVGEGRARGVGKRAERVGLARAERVGLARGERAGLGRGERGGPPRRVAARLRVQRDEQLVVSLAHLARAVCREGVVHGTQHGQHRLAAHGREGSRRRHARVRSACEPEASHSRSRGGAHERWREVSECGGARGRGARLGVARYRGDIGEIYGR